ncbi:PEP-CTERM sorting domain-containing protein [Bradyrhizobium sp. SK17]|uniref:PEP-CTERM sorting domain-containing protein n=1 Tax=Bradyrhizobium sp. SK17 TaxID=2057741 RepID=UPI0012FD5383|nr:PEP-CTERM sorting domain-containing protein [Bradyrhizobium sp. SK17]
MVFRLAFKMTARSTMIALGLTMAFADHASAAVCGGTFSATGGGVQCTVGQTGQYLINAVGGSGGGTSNSAVHGGFGASVSAEYYLTAGEVLDLYVGQAGASALSSGGGGGGSFVLIDSSRTVLLVGGGGGGAGYNGNGTNASLTPDGTAASVSQGSAGGAGGTGGYGGASNGGSGGGGGILGNGATGNGSSGGGGGGKGLTGSPVLAGGAPRDSISGAGGFGGGGGAGAGTGAGGGYSGGGGTSSYGGFGGGGGSFVNNSFEGYLFVNLPELANTLGDGFITIGLAPSVPEPSTWAMMLLGFAGLGFMAFRRRAITPFT